MKALSHGTQSGYAYHKCRCDLCKKAHADYMRPYVKKAGNKYDRRKEKPSYTKNLAKEPDYKFTGKSRS